MLRQSQNSGGVIWLTGLSGAGKTTIANLLVHKLQNKNLDIEQLDGDAIREIFPSTGFLRSERDQHIRRIGFLASRLEAHGVIVIASLISPFNESREFVRGLCKNYFEVFVDTSLEDCEDRDPKGLYKKARAGLIKNFTGIDDPYDIPQNSELKISTKLMTAEQAADQILVQFLKRTLVTEKPKCSPPI